MRSVKGSLLFTLVLFTEVHSQCTDYYSQKDCPPDERHWKTLPACKFTNDTLPSNALVFVVIGDYGLETSNCEKHGRIDFMITVGDNDYWTGSCESLNQNIGQFWGSFFPPPGNCVNPSVDSNVSQIRFFPSLGNHDFDTYIKFGVENLPYLQYFDYLRRFPPLEAQGQYYSVDPTSVFASLPSQRGVVELFVLNSNDHSPASQQEWLKGALQNSTAPWKIVYFHHSPFTTAHHDPPAVWMRWPFEEWGASLVLSGHEHVYERILKGPTHFPYVINGLGGHPWIYDITGPACPPEEGSVVRYNTAHGAALAIVTSAELQMCFYSIEDGGTLVDQFFLSV